MMGHKVPIETMNYYSAPNPNENPKEGKKGTSDTERGKIAKDIKFLIQDSILIGQAP